MRNETGAVLGFRPHTYWTAVVALAAPVELPRVVARSAIVFASEGDRFVFHQAAELDTKLAQRRLVERVSASTQRAAADEIGTMLATLAHDGIAVDAAVVPGDAEALPDDMAGILRTHARIHAMEGVFYRTVVASACRSAGLTVHRVVERELPTLVGERLRLTAAELSTRLKTMGAALGPPWNVDYRLATLAAWSGLSPHALSR